MGPLLYFIKSYFPLETFNELNLPIDLDLNNEISKKELSRWSLLPPEYLSEKDHFQLSLHYFKISLYEDDGKIVSENIMKALSHNQSIEADRSDITQLLLGHLYLKLATKAHKSKQRKLIQLAKSCYQDINDENLKAIKSMHLSLCFWMLEEHSQCISSLQRDCKGKDFPMTGNLILSKMFSYQGLNNIAHFYHERYQKSLTMAS